MPKRINTCWKNCEENYLSFSQIHLRNMYYTLDHLQVFSLSLSIFLAIKSVVHPLCLTCGKDFCYGERPNMCRDSVLWHQPCRIDHLFVFYFTCFWVLSHDFVIGMWGQYSFLLFIVFCKAGKSFLLTSHYLCSCYNALPEMLMLLHRFLNILPSREN